MNILIVSEAARAWMTKTTTQLLKFVRFIEDMNVHLHFPIKCTVHPSIAEYHALGRYG